MKKKLWILSFIMAMVFMMAGANLASAYIITANDIQDSTSVVINPGANDNTGGMTNWIIGTSSSSQLELQWFWFKIGGYTTRLGDRQETASNVFQDVTITAYEDFNRTTFFTNQSESASIYIDYAYGSDLMIQTGYSIDGGFDPPYGHIHESLKIINNSSTVLQDVRLYEYNDFNLAGTQAGDTAVADGQYAITQFDGNAAITEISRSIGISSGAYQIGNQIDILDAVTTGATLLNTPSPGTEFTGNDTAWAFSWNFNLAKDGGSFSLSKDKITVTPVPATLLLFGSGLFSLIGVGIKRRKS